MLMGKSIVMRIPTVPGKNDGEENMKNTAVLAESLEGVKMIHLLPYHTVGIDKYHSVGLSPKLTEKPGNIKERCEYLADLMGNYTSKPIKVIG